ncbi:MAG: hypothetical protein WC644_01155 [Ignavibacteria bacterium]
MKDYIKYYDLEKYLFDEVYKNYHKSKKLNTFEFFAIVIWKANRAKSKTAKRLLKLHQERNHNTDLGKCVEEITSKVYSAKTHKERMRILYEEYEFKLPMASAILTVLYPKDFTVYDVRVCEILKNDKNINNLSNFDNVWKGYQEFVEDVKSSTKEKLSLRDKDKALWGKSFYNQLIQDIKENFPKRTN